MPFDPILILLFAVLGVFIVLQVRNGRKRRRETEERQTQFVPGAEVMTNYGLYGTIVSIDDDRNLAILEVSPGNEIKVHRQTILKLADYDSVPVDDAVVDDAAAVADESAPDSGTDRPQLNTDTAVPLGEGADQQPAAPRYGERVDDAPKTARSGDKPGDQ